MAISIRRMARLSGVALIAALAPAASAVVQAAPSFESVEASAAAEAPAERVTLTREQGRDAGRAAGTAMVREAIRLHNRAREEAVSLGALAQEAATRIRRQAAEDARAAAAVEAEAAGLVPGEYVWRPEGSSGPVEIVTSLSAQRLYVFRGGRLIGVSTVSTGMEGHRTPTGSYPILQKKKMHYSNLYDDAPMPNMQRMTWDGIALHAGRIRPQPASHGCVRLPSEFSSLLYGVTRIGSIVHVVDAAPARPGRALAMVAGAGGGARSARAR